MCGLEIMLVRLSLGDRFLDKIRMKYRRLFESVYKYTHWLLIIGMKGVRHGDYACSFESG